MPRGRQTRRLRLVHLELQRIAPIGEIAKQIGQIGVAYGFASFIRHEILF